MEKRARSTRKEINPKKEDKTTEKLFEQSIFLYERTLQQDLKEKFKPKMAKKQEQYKIDQEQQFDWQEWINTIRFNTIRFQRIHNIDPDLILNEIEIILRQRHMQMERERKTLEKTL